MKKGSKVKMTYVGKLADGTVFDSASADAPMEFVVDIDPVMSGLTKKVLELEQGDKVSFTVPDYDGFGEYLENKVETMARSVVPFPPGEEPYPGKIIYNTVDEGYYVPVTVLDVTESEITLDFNHPLAGQELYFEVEILEVTPPETKVRDEWVSPGYQVPGVSEEQLEKARKIREEWE